MGWQNHKLFKGKENPIESSIKLQMRKSGTTSVGIYTPTIEGAQRRGWIQVFFAHNLANEEIANLFEKRIENLRAYLSQCQLAQKSIDGNYKQVGIKRLRDLWQLTLDYGINYYENEIVWLEKRCACSQTAHDGNAKETLAIHPKENQK
jgi:hypothetical protein